VSELEGLAELNLPQLLELMHDVVTPEPVPWLPQTVGWWVLAAWLLAVVLLVARHAHRTWQGNRYRREALAALSSIEAQPGKNGAAQLAVLLKRTALAAYPRDKVAHLYGAEWAGFLSESTGHDPSVAAGAHELARAAYRKDADVAALLEPARRWIKAHRG
jgi:hypothetical protein